MGERNVADTEARLKNDIRQKQQEAFEKIGAVEQQAELRSAEASRRLGALDLRMSGVQGGLGEHKRDILKLREEVNGLTVKRPRTRWTSRRTATRCGRWRSSGTSTSRIGRRRWTRCTTCSTPRSTRSPSRTSSTAWRP